MHTAEVMFVSLTSGFHEISIPGKNRCSQILQNIENVLHHHLQSSVKVYRAMLHRFEVFDEHVHILFEGGDLFGRQAQLADADGLQEDVEGRLQSGQSRVQVRGRGVTCRQPAQVAKTGRCKSSLNNLQSR